MGSVPRSVHQREVRLRAGMHRKHRGQEGVREDGREKSVREQLCGHFPGPSGDRFGYSLQHVPERWVGPGHLATLFHLDAGLPLALSEPREFRHLQEERVPAAQVKVKVKKKMISPSFQDHLFYFFPSLLEFHSIPIQSESLSKMFLSCAPLSFSLSSSKSSRILAFLDSFPSSPASFRFSFRLVGALYFFFFSFVEPPSASTSAISSSSSLLSPPSSSTSLKPPISQGLGSAAASSFWSGAMNPPLASFSFPELRGTRLLFCVHFSCSSASFSACFLASSSSHTRFSSAFFRICSSLALFSKSMICASSLYLQC
mmetsp:Transcript_9567/g.23823  ORF Transcript_9567/g.23823 Transcript_9567/m.23823 type:complete len:315 (-) Transcript_9567:197-1141(-)